MKASSVVSILSTVGPIEIKFEVEFEFMFSAVGSTFGAVGVILGGNGFIFGGNELISGSTEFVSGPIELTFAYPDAALTVV